jgi:hypothetical protein
MMAAHEECLQTSKKAKAENSGPMPRLSMGGWWRARESPLEYLLPNVSERIEYVILMDQQRINICHANWTPRGSTCSVILQALLGS